MRKLRKGTYVEVMWEDAYVSLSGAKAEDFIRDYKPYVRTTVGVVVGQDEERLFVASTSDDPTLGDGGTGHDCAEINIIPYGMINSITPLAPKA